MNKRILLGVDASISPATQHALHKVSEFIQEAAPQLHVILLNVIPVPYMTAPMLGMHVAQAIPLSATLEQRYQAEETLHRARTELQQRGIAPTQIEELIRVGAPADEIVKAARELHTDFIVIGSRGDSLKEKMRRFLTGSISRRVLELAPCPVMIVVSPKTSTPTDLVSWYEEAITGYLREHTGSLTVFTSREVAKLFAPPSKRKPGRKEIAAAVLALEHLSRNGILCRHDVKGELRYVND